MYLNKSFEIKPITSLKRKKKPSEMNFGNKKFGNKVKKSFDSLKTTGKCNPCNSRKNILRWKPS